MTKAEVMGWLERSRIVPVVRAGSVDEALVVADALVAGGLTVLEIGLTVPGAYQVLEELSGRLGGSVLVGAGTVLNEVQARACVLAGARFVVSPCFNPGALTPTEVNAAWLGGADLVKIFPCDAMGGSAYLKSLRAVFPTVPLFPTGGVTLQNIRSFVEAGALAVGVGSNLVNVELVRQGRVEELVELARAFALALPTTL